MTISSAWLPCLQTLCILGLEAGLVTLTAAALQRRIRAASRQRALWQAALLGLLLLTFLEVSGLSRGLIGSARIWAVSSSPPPSLAASPTLSSGSGNPVFDAGPSLAEFKERAAVQRGRDALSSGSEINAQRVNRTAPTPLLVPAYSVVEDPPVEPFLQDPSMPWLELTWLIGIMAVLCPVGVARMLFRVFQRRGSAVLDGALLERAAFLGRRLGLRQRVRVFESPRLTTPIAFGLLRPTLGLPANFARTYSAAQQDVILAHELAHLAAHDPSWLALADLVTAVLWWHPCAWWARNRLRSTAETAADEASLLLADGPGLLAECLLELASRLERPSALGWVAMTGSGIRSQLGRRIERLLHPPQRSWTPLGPVEAWTFRSLLPLALTGLAVLCTAWVNPGSSSKGANMQSFTHTWKRSVATLALFAASGAEPGHAQLNSATAASPPAAVTSRAAEVLATPQNAGASSPVVQVTHSPQPAAAAPADIPGLVAYWSFDESAGPVAHDSAGQFPGKLSPGAAFVNGGVRGNALRLDRRLDGYVSLGNVLGFDASGFTISAWVRLTPRDATENLVVAAKHEGYTSSGYFLAVNRSNSILGRENKGMFFCGDSTPVPVSTSNVNDGLWHQLVAVHELDGANRLYVDGVLESSAPAGAVSPNASSFLIGAASYDGKPKGLFTGLIDELQIYSRALGAREVSLLYRGVAQGAVASSTAAGGERAGSKVRPVTDSPAEGGVPFRLDPALAARYGLTFHASPARSSRGKQQIEDKLNQIVLDEVFYDGLPLIDVVHDLIDTAGKRDPDKRGINFLISNLPDTQPMGAIDPLTGQPIPSPSTVDLKNVTVRLHLRDVRLKDVLDALPLVCDSPVKYSVEEYGVVLSPGSGPMPNPGFPRNWQAESVPLQVRTFKVDTNTFLPGLESAFGIGLETEHNPATGRDAELATPKSSPAIQQALRRLLRQLGINMDFPNKAVFYNALTGIVMVRASSEDLDVVQAAIETLGGKAFRPGLAGDGQKPAGTLF